MPSADVIAVMTPATSPKVSGNHRRLSRARWS
jgi:hypothetical protein